MEARAPGTVLTELRTGLLAGQPAARLNVRCDHGSSSWFVLRGTDPRGNLAALELARRSHGSRTGCDCR